MPTLSDVCALTATEIRAEIGAGRLSARETLEAHLQRIEACNPQVNAIVTLDVEGARRQAAAADEAQAQGKPLGLLHGLPIAHKDSFLTAGMRTTFGSPLFRDFIPDRDSLVVSREKAAGAISLGKTNLPEFGAGSHTFNPVFGATRNPYDLTRSAGGSSGGAAAALACRMLPLADGSDMGGSLRNPASFCNVVGLRSSPGRVAQWPTGNPYSPLTVAGPMARTVADVALMLAAISGADARDPLSIAEDPHAFTQPLEREFRGTRIAYARDWGGLPVDPAVTRVLDGCLPVFESLGCNVESGSPDFSGAEQSFQVLRGLAFLLSHGDQLRQHRDQLKDAVVWNTERGLATTGQDMADADRHRAALVERMRLYMQTHEFLIGPVSQVPPFPVEQEYPTAIDGVAMNNYIDWMRSGYYVSMTGHPAISVPCGFTEQGLPVGIQIVGRWRDERGLLQLAHAFEQATQIWKRAPTLDGKPVSASSAERA
jgi:amidase